MLEVNTEFKKIEGDKLLYTVRQILVATYFGGLIAGCWLIADNADVFEDYQVAKNFRFGGFVLTLAFGVAAPFIVDIIPRRVLPALITFVIYYFCKRLLENRIKIHFLLGGERRRWLKVAGISLASILLTLVIAGLPIFLMSRYL